MRHIALAFVLFTGACATTSRGTRITTYHPQSVTIAAVKPVVCDAITRLARAEGWQLVNVAPQDGRVEALSATQMTLGIGMRERWLFTLADYDVNVTRHLEVQFEQGGNWETEEAVAANYGYERERQVLASLGAQFSLVIPAY